MGTGSQGLKLPRLLRNPKIGILAVLAVSTGLALHGQTVPPTVLGNLVIAFAAAVFAQWTLFGYTSTSSFQSAAITGMISGMLLAPSVDPLLLWFAPVAAIASKRFLKFDKVRHIFNPATAGLVITSILFSNQINWWGFSSPILLILGAGAVLYRMNRLSLPFAYILGRGLSSLAVGGVTLGIRAFMLPNLFFAFIMLVEPKTSPARRPAQWCFGALCGILATVCFKLVPSLDGDLMALLLVNLSRPLLKRIAERSLTTVATRGT